jgi:rubrerythrin
MRFGTIQDVVDFARKLHTALSDQYAELEQLSSSERARLMLDYLNRHEQNLAQAMDKYEGDMEQSIAALWLQDVPELQSEELVDKVRGVDLADVDNIIGVALDVDKYLIKVYQRMADEVDSDAGRDVFKSLIKLEDNERHRLSRAAFRLADM